MAQVQPRIVNSIREGFDLRLEKLRPVWNLTGYDLTICDSLELKLRTNPPRSSCYVASYPSWERIEPTIGPVQNWVSLQGLRSYFLSRTDLIRPADGKETDVYLQDSICLNFFITASTEAELRELIEEQLEFSAYSYRTDITTSISGDQVKVYIDKIDNRRYYDKQYCINLDYFKGPVTEIQENYKIDIDDYLTIHPTFPPGNGPQWRQRVQEKYLYTKSSRDLALVYTHPSLTPAQMQNINARLSEGRLRRRPSQPPISSNDSSQSDVSFSRSGPTYSLGCQPSVLPFYYADVVVKYAPQRGQTRFSVKLRDRNIALHSPDFRVRTVGLRSLTFPEKTGEKQLRFDYANLGSLNPDDLTLRIFYTNSESKLANLSNTSQLTISTAHLRAQGQEIKGGMFFPRRAYSFHDDVGTMISNTETTMDNSNPVDDIRPALFGANEQVYFRFVLLQRIGSSRQDTLYISNLHQFQMPAPISIALVGDSYAAGEGAPWRGDGASWLDCDCHRSIWSGHYQAVCRLIKENSQLDIQFLNLACTGETILSMLPRDVLMSAGYLPYIYNTHDRVSAIKDWLIDNNLGNLSLLLMSTGGNDAGFADFIKNAIIWPTATAETWLDIMEDVEELGRRYTLLQKTIASQLHASEIMITEYPNPTLGEDGICDRDIDASWGGMSPEELSMANDFHGQLMEQLRESATENGWQLITGIINRYSGHGICNFDEPYFNTTTEADAIAACELCSTLPHYKRWQCAFHPNQLGYSLGTKPAVLETLRSWIESR